MLKNIYAIKNKSIYDSSSGAAFPTIEHILRRKNKLIVYGAAFDSNMKVRHFRADNELDTVKFRGSKYIESDISGIYLLVEQDLLEDKADILFTGTPCQIAGLKRYLEKKQRSTNRLFLVDVLCHGTPSRKCWNEYLEWLEKKHKACVINYSFRRNGNICIFAEFDNGKKITNTKDLKMFFDLFNSPKMLQERCFNCHFAGMKNESDISIGDFWGIKKVMPDFPYNEGVSVVIVNTVKGQEIINSIVNKSAQDKSILIKKCENDEILNCNPPLRAPTPRTKQRDNFLKDYKKGWNFLYRKYCLRQILSKIKHIIIK